MRLLGKRCRQKFVLLWETAADIFFRMEESLKEALSAKYDQVIVMTDTQKYLLRALKNVGKTFEKNHI